MKETNKTAGTVFKRLLLALILVIVFFLTAVNSYFRLPVNKYYSASKKAFKIPEINKGFIPQGLSYDSGAGDFYMTGYMKDNSASPIYIVDKDTGKVRKNILMANSDGTPFIGHNGGIEVFKGKVYVGGVGNSNLYVYDPSAIRAADNGSMLPYDSIVDLSSENDSIAVAFLTSYNDELIVGEFYRAKSYPTDESHWVETGKQSNKAIAVSFKLVDNKPVPTAVYSLPNQVQGMFVTDDNIYLSTSYGVAFSHILTYSKDKLASNDVMHILDTDLPLYILDDNCLVSDTKIPPMSEEIEIVNGKMYVQCESASDKYIFGKLTGAKRCYATDISLFTESE